MPRERDRTWECMTTCRGAAPEATSQTSCVGRTVRFADERDAEAVARVVRRSLAADEGREPPTEVDRALPQWLARIRSDDDWVLVASANDGIVGVCHGRSARDVADPAAPLVPGVAHLTNLFVDRQSWDSGHARALLRASYDVIRDRGFSTARLWTVLASHRARHLYESEGWSLTGRYRLMEWGEDVEYERALLVLPPDASE